MFNQNYGKPDSKPPKREKKAPKSLKRTPLKKKYKVSGEAKIFFEIWNERAHRCVNCKESLGNEAKTWFFAHILSKKQHAELRLVKTNIMLLCFECHQAYDQGTKEQYAKRGRCQ